MIISLTISTFLAVCIYPTKAGVLETIVITENDVTIQRLANLTEILLNKKKIPPSSLKNIEIVPLLDSNLYPFKLQSNQLLQPNNGVDRESICSDKTTKVSLKLCKSTNCCKLVGFQYSIATEIITSFVLVQILDQNDQVPQFPLIKRPFFKIPENVEIGYVLDLPMAYDRDSEKYAVQRYTLSNIYQLDQSMDFRLYQTNDIPPRPQLIVNSKLDFEKTNKYTFRLYAYDFDDKTTGNSCSTTVEIEIEDLNDNPPKFNQLLYTANVEENKRNDKLIKYIIFDPDSARNGLVTVSINDKTDELMKKFQIYEIHKNEGYLGLINPLDYETDPHLYEFSLIAVDQGNPPLSSTTQVRIHLKNQNDNGPKIRFKKIGHSVSNSVAITEGLKPHSVVVEVRVTDLDTPINMISCRLIDHVDLFYLDGPNKANELLDFNQYNLKTIATIDRESSYGPFLRVTIQCTDGDIYSPITTNESLNIQIEDINDNIPIFSQQNYVGTIDENQINMAVTFVKPIIVSDKDSGQNGKFQFSLEDFVNMTDSLDFLCERISGKIVTQKGLDFEMKKSYRFKIVAVDNGVEPLRSTATLTINVKDVNDNAPKFADSHYIFYVAENVNIGTKIGSLRAQDADTDQTNKDIYYSIEGNGDNVNCIEIDRLTGDLRTRKSLDREAFDSITFKVVARNLNVLSNQMIRSTDSEVDIIIKITDVNDNPPQFKQRPHTKSRVEFVIEQYVEGSTCSELPYTVHDADFGESNGQNCCYTTLENDYNKLFTLMTETPTYICLSKKPEKYQSLTVTLIARDRPNNSEESLKSKISFPVIIKNDPNKKSNENKHIDPKEPVTQSYNDSKNLIIVGILITVVLVVIIIIIIIIIIIRRCSITERDCDNKFYQTIDSSINRAAGTKPNYIMSEQDTMAQCGMSPGKTTIPRGYLAPSQYSDSLHKTLSCNIQPIHSNVSPPFTPSTYHQILTNQGLRIIQNPNRFNDPYIYEWSSMSDDQERSMNINQRHVEKARSVSPTKSNSIHNNSKILNEEQQDSGYQILNPFGLSSSTHPNLLHYNPENQIPCDNEMITTDSRSLTLLNNLFDKNNIISNPKQTPGALKKNYFQTTFV